MFKNKYPSEIRTYADLFLSLPLLLLLLTFCSLVYYMMKKPPHANLPSWITKQKQVLLYLHLYVSEYKNKIK